MVTNARAVNEYGLYIGQRVELLVDIPRRRELYRGLQGTLMAPQTPLARSRSWRFSTVRFPHGYQDILTWELRGEVPDEAYRRYRIRMLKEMVSALEVEVERGEDLRDPDEPGVLREEIAWLEAGNSALSPQAVAPTRHTHQAAMHAAIADQARYDDDTAPPEQAGEAFSALSDEDMAVASNLGARLLALPQEDQRSIIRAIKNAEKSSR